MILIPLVLAKLLLVPVREILIDLSRFYKTDAVIFVSNSTCDDIKILAYNSVILESYQIFKKSSTVLYNPIRSAILFTISDVSRD